MGETPDVRHSATVSLSFIRGGPDCRGFDADQPSDSLWFSASKLIAAT